jgi:DNA-binding NarL/FixJ family response regulator
MTGHIRVVIIDDQMLVRAGLRMILEAEDDIEIVGEAGDGQACLDIVRAMNPDVVLMDIRMPVLDGVQATQRLTGMAGIGTRVLVLTTIDTDDAVLDAMRAGASGFLLKDTDPDDLVKAIRAVAAGDAVVSPSAMRRLLDRVGPALRGVAESAPPTAAPAAGVPAPSPPAGMAELTQREIEVLTLIGEGLTNAEIAARLFVAESTAKTHIGRILLKLGARDRVQAAIIAHRWGLVG